MRITFQKRQKEFKRQEKQRAKAEKCEQKKLAKRLVEVQGTVTTLSPDPGQQLQSEDKDRVPPE